MNLTKLDALIYEIIVDANGEDEQLCGRFARLSKTRSLCRPMDL
jgi:hypothetical protein